MIQECKTYLCEGPTDEEILEAPDVKKNHLTLLYENLLNYMKYIIEKSSDWRPETPPVEGAVQE